MEGAIDGSIQQIADAANSEHGMIISHGAFSFMIVVVCILSKYWRHQRERLNTNNTIGVVRIDVIPTCEEYIEEDVQEDVESHFSSFSTSHQIGKFPPRVYI